MSQSPEVKRAVFGLLVAMMAIDAKVDGDELDQLMARARAHPLFAGVSDKELGKLLKSSAADVRKNGAFEMIARWALVVPADLAESAFALVIQAMIADGAVHVREGDFGEALRETLKISKERALAITERAIAEAGKA